MHRCLLLLLPTLGDALRVPAPSGTTLGDASRVPTPSFTTRSLGRRAVLHALPLAAITPACALAAVVDPSVANERWQPKGDPRRTESYLQQLRSGQAALEGLLADWTKVTARTNGDGSPDGDAVRRVVGTVGVASPLFGIERVLKTVGRDLDERDLLADPAEFTEQIEEVINGLRDVDYLAYSAIFSDPSGNAGKKGQTSKDYLERSRVAASQTLTAYRQLMGMIPDL